MASGLGSALRATTIKTDASWARTPGTLSPSASNTTVVGTRGAHRVPGNVYTIAEAQGKLAGRNLFHSFESFSIGAGDAAVFTTSTTALNNVISRVSGTAPSTINGLLALSPAAGSAPNFFFVNPNGVAFGGGAQVDVPAAFHVSTADSLIFSDRTVFKAGNGPDSTLTIEAPEAFGFLGNRQAASVTLDNLDSSGNGQRPRLKIELAPGSMLDITGGAVQISAADLTVSKGILRVAATGNAAVEMPVSGGPGEHSCRRNRGHGYGAVDDWDRSDSADGRTHDTARRHSSFRECRWRGHYCRRVVFARWREDHHKRN